MSELPEWIDERIDSQLNNKLTQQHVVETMLGAERPFFSIRQLQSRLNPDVGKGTVRNRLDELREIDIVAAEEYPESITLYYINHPESNWPLSPEGKRTLRRDSPIERLTITGFLTLRDSVGINRLITAGFRLSIVLFCIGIFMNAFGIAAPIWGDHRMSTAAYLLFSVCLLLLLAEKIARSVRNQNWTTHMPSSDRSQ